jgi:PAS domain S-box-containing protein
MGEGEADALRRENEALRRQVATLETESRPFVAFFDNAPIGKSMTAPDGRLVRVNAAFGAMLGYSLEELQTISFASITHPDDVAESRECVRALLAGERDTWTMEKRYLAKDGRHVWTHVTTRLQRDDHGRPVHFLTHVEDITERKRAEAALRFSEARNRATLRSIGDGVISTDTSGCVTQMNPVAQALTGWTEEDVLGTPLAHVFRIVNEETRAEVESPVDRVLREGLVVGLANHTVLVAKDGTDRPIADSGAPIRDARGELTGVVLVFRDQTDERAAQRSLQESEHRYRATFEQAAVGIAHVGLDGTWLRVNQRICDIVGYASDELLQKTFQDITHPDDVAADVKYVHQVLAGEIQTYSMEKRYIRKDRSLVWINLTVSLMRDDAGDPKYFVSVVEDISARKRMEQRIAHLNLVLQAIRDVNQLIVREKDAGTLIRRCCEVLTEARGYFGAWIALYDESGEYRTGASAGLGDAFGALEHRIRSGQLAACGQALRECGVHVVRDPTAECPACPAAALYKGQSAIAVRLEHEGRVHGLLVISTESGLVDLAEEHNLIEEVADDIAYALHGLNVEQRRFVAAEALSKQRDELEQRVAERTAELQLSKTLVDETSKLAKVGGWEIDLEKNELSWTDVVHEIHEVEPGFRPTVQSGINFYAPEAVPVISDAVRRAIEEGEPFDLELQLVTAKKNRIWVRAIGEVVRENGRIAKVRGVFQEINQRKLAEIELAKHREYLRDRTAQLEETNKELEAFSYSVSHDLRAPLRAIDGFTRILADDYAPRLDTEGKRVCSVIRENTGRMGRLIDDLLAFSRLGRTEMQPSRIDMGAMANAVFYELTTPEVRERIDFKVGSLPAAIGDPSLMRQVWANLLGNALKFSSKRKRAAISVIAEQKNGDLVFAVKDNGAGFDMQYVHKLFGVFQRLHGMREFEGTGVGLALVQRVIRRHGGRVWAEGETDKGATFYFALTEQGS